MARKPRSLRTGSVAVVARAPRQPRSSRKPIAPGKWPTVVADNLTPFVNPYNPYAPFNPNFRGTRPHPLQRYHVNAELMRRKYRLKMQRLPVFVPEYQGTRPIWPGAATRPDFVPNYKFDKAMSNYIKWLYIM